MRERRRTVLQLLGAGFSVGVSGCSTFSKYGLDGAKNPTTESVTGKRKTTIDDRVTESTISEQTTTSESIDAPPSVYQSVSIPDKPSKYQYPMMGDGDAPVTATVYGAWKCPYTQNFVLEDMTSIIEQYVEPGNVALEFRAVAYEDGEGFHGPDEPRAARAGLAVWHFDPTSYWSYFGYLFQNQQSFDGWATIKRLLRFAKKAGVRHRDRIESEIESRSYQSQIEETMSRVQKIPIPAVPRVVVDGTVTVPTVAPERTRTQLERALEQASNSNGGTTTKGSGMTTTTSHSSSA